jgi:hypothetical protein
VVGVVVFGVIADVDVEVMLVVAEEVAALIPPLLPPPQATTPTVATAVMKNRRNVCIRFLKQPLAKTSQVKERLLRLYRVKRFHKAPAQVRIRYTNFV